MDCVFMVTLFHHMVVDSDKISGGRRTLISMTRMRPVCFGRCGAMRSHRKAIKGDDDQI